MAGVRVEAFEVERGVAEPGAGLAGRVRDHAAQRLVVPDEVDPAPAAAVHGLDQHRVADAVGDPERLVDLGELAARGHRDAGALGGRAGGGLVAELAQGRRARSGERDPGLLARFGEGGLLAAEPVAGVEDGGARGLRGGDEQLRAQVGRAAGGGTDAQRPVRELRRERVAVGGADRHHR